MPLHSWALRILATLVLATVTTLGGTAWRAMAAAPENAPPPAVEVQAPTPTSTPTLAPIANDVQRLTAGLPRDGFEGVPCANAVGAICRIDPAEPPTNGVSGTARVTGSMAVQISVAPDLIPAGYLAHVFFNTSFGIENVDCPRALAATAITCVGDTIGNLI
jgi:hypothetical protein